MDDFVELYRREAEMVPLFCARRVLDAEAALDLTAETFAQAFRGRRSFRGTSEPEERARRDPLPFAGRPTRDPRVGTTTVVVG